MTCSFLVASKTATISTLTADSITVGSMFSQGTADVQVVRAFSITSSVSTAINGSVSGTLTADYLTVSSVGVGGTLTAGCLTASSVVCSAASASTACVSSAYVVGTYSGIPSRIKVSTGDMSSGYSAQSTVTIAVIDGTNYPGYTVWFDSSRIASSVSMDAGATITMRMTTTNVSTVVCQLDANSIGATFREVRMLADSPYVNKHFTLTSGVIASLTATVGAGAGFTGGKVNFMGWMEPTIALAPSLTAM